MLKIKIKEIRIRIGILTSIHFMELIKKSIKIIKAITMNTIAILILISKE